MNVMLNILDKLYYYKYLNLPFRRASKVLARQAVHLFKFNSTHTDPLERNEE